VPEDPRAFVSYAGEDRDVAQSIARALNEMGIPTFYDRDSLNPGDSIVEQIHEALAQVDFGVLVISPAFLEKNWPRHETLQLVRAYIDGRTRLLPVRHNVSQEEVEERQPALADIWAVNTEDGLRAVVRGLAGRMIEDATIAVVPVYQRPVERFRMGVGELTEGIEGPAFNAWEALLHFAPDEFPFFVEGEIIERSELLARAGEIIASDEGAMNADAATLRRLKELCNAELGFEFQIGDQG
jgi:hypothetical protein